MGDAIAAQPASGFEPAFRQCVAVRSAPDADRRPSRRPSAPVASMKSLNIGRIRPPSSRTIIAMSRYIALRLASSSSARAASTILSKSGRRKRVSFQSAVEMIGGGIHLVLRRAAAPVGGREGLLVPDFRPVAVARLALDLDCDAGLGAALLVELGGVDGAGEGDVRGAQQDRAVMAGLLVVERWPCRDRTCAARCRRRTAGRTR